MLLTITTTHRPASDLGYLLHKHPDRFQSFDLSFGKAHVFYPEVGDERCTACLLLDVDPVGMVRGKNPDQNFLLGQYVNDRPYVASSFMSVAIAQVFGSALQGRCKDRPELVDDADPARSPDRRAAGAGRRDVPAGRVRAAGLRGRGRPPPAGRAVPRVGREPVLLGDDPEDDHAGGAADAPVRPDPGVRQPASTTSSATTRWRSCWRRARAGWPGTRRRKRSPAATCGSSRACTGWPSAASSRKKSRSKARTRRPRRRRPRRRWRSRSASTSSGSGRSWRRCGRAGPSGCSTSAAARAS